MSNFNDASLNFNPSAFPNSDYSNVKSLNKDDILSTIDSLPTRPLTQINQSTQYLQLGNGSLLRTRNNSANRSILNQYSYGLNWQRHANTKSDLIPADRTCNNNEKEIIKYGLESLPKVIDKLSSEAGKVFSIITDKKEFNILIDDASIPHILGLLNVDDTINEKNKTRIYKEAKEQLEVIKNSNESIWKRIKRKEYIKTIKNVIIQYKDKILHTFSAEDDYEKDLLGKVSFKICNLEYIFSELNINDINNFNIFKSKNNDNSFLMAMPISNESSYCCLVITKQENDFTYSLESGGILTGDEFESILYSTQFADQWTNSNLSTKNFIFKTGNINLNIANDLEEQRKRKNSKFVGINLKSIKNKNATMELSKSINKPIIDKQFNEIINRNDCTILKEIYSLLINNDKSIISKELPLMLIKLYQNFMSKEKNNIINEEDYYKTLLILANEFSKDIKIKNLLNACYSNNITEIGKVLDEMNDAIDNNEKNCEFTASVSISKVDSKFYLSTLLNIKSDLISIEKNKEVNNEIFADQILKTNNELENIYKQIQSIKISNINEAKMYVKLMNEFYNMYEIIQSSILNLYSYCMTSNLRIDDICELANKYPNIFNLLTEIGYDKPVLDNNGYLDKLINEIKDNISENSLYSELNEYINRNEIITLEETFDRFVELEQNEALLLIKLNSLVLIKGITSKLKNNNYAQNLHFEEEKLNILLTIRDEFSNIKTLKMAG